MPEYTAKIIETETEMSDGSINVHCEAVTHDGQRVAAGYRVPRAVSLPGCDDARYVHHGNGTYERRDDYRARHRDTAHRAIRAKVAEIIAAPRLEIVPGSIAYTDGIDSPTIADADPIVPNEAE